MSQPKQYELDGKTYWVIDDETTYELFSQDDEFEPSDICGMCVDGSHPEKCPTRVALGLGLEGQTCECVILSEEGYAHYIAKRMGA